MTHVVVNRGELVKRLAVVDLGLSKEGLIEQSSCYVFRDGKVWTYNGEVVCSADLPSGMEEVECAVPADEFRDLLSKLDDETEIVLESRETEDATELVLSVGNRRAGIRVQKEIALPIDGIEVPDQWSEMPEGFAEAVETVQGCASKHDSAFALSCVHITPTGLEASDRYQGIRYMLETGLDGDVLVRKDGLVKVCKLGVSEWAVGRSWLFFRGPSRLVVGCRLWDAQFPKLSPYFEVVDGSKVVFPKAILSAVERAEIFLDEKGGSECVTVDFEPSGLLLRSEGPVGWYEERLEASYEGVPWKISIAPRLLREIFSRSESALVGNDKLLVKSAQFEYVSACRVD